MRQAGASVSFDGVWIGDIPEAERFKRLDRLQGELCELRKRWDNRLILERISYWKEYVRGRLSLACYLKRKVRIDQAKRAGSECGDIAVHELNTVLLIFKAHPGHLKDLHDRDDKLVFVHSIKLVDFPQFEVPSLVRLNTISDEVGQIGNGLLYKSERLGGYKVVPFPTDGEGNSSIVLPDVVGGDVVEGGSHIVNGVPKGQRNAGGKTDGPGIQTVFSGLRVYIGDQSVEVCLDEVLKDRFDLLDVAVGPLNL